MAPKATATGTDGEILDDRVSVALTKSDKRELRRATFNADAYSVSAFIRAAALKAARRTNEAAEKKAA